MYEVRPRMRLSEGSNNNKSKLDFVVWFKRVLVGARGLGVLRSNLGSDFQGALITKKIV